MKGLKTFIGLVSIFITTPIWYYLVYQVLARVNASELMWFLYWIYLPVGIFCVIAMKLAEAVESGK